MLVSVYCLTYNHEPYIRDTLEGFVNQKTNFKFEVLVHDDASTDGTAAIVKEYAEKYPEIIRPILQKENLYSQGINILNTQIRPNVRGKYIAICEGDDYWTDSNKLQRQVDFLENNQEYSACVHNTVLYDMLKEQKRVMFSDKDRDITLKDVIYAGSQSYHTSSVLYRVEYFYNRPAYFHVIKGVGDYPLSIHLASNGKIKYFSDVMSLYRYNVKGSWTARNGNGKEGFIRMHKNAIILLTEAKKECASENIPLFDDAIKFNEYKARMFAEDYSVLKENAYKKFYQNETMTDKMKIMIKKNMRGIYRIYLSCKKEK